MKSVTIHEAKTHLSRLLVEIEAGEEIVICRGKQAIAHLVPLPTEPRRRRPEVGTVTSAAVSYQEDAFAPLTEGELDEWGL